MYRLEREEFVTPRYVTLWGALGFQAGFINALGFLACGRYVSHMTGFGTQVGVAMARGDGVFAAELLGMPASFVLGAFSSAVVTSARIERQLRPRFDLVTLAMPLLLGAVLVLGWFGFFGPFGEQMVLARDFILLFSLAFLCGLQNGCFAVLTKGQIRTTHLTGISTDMGTDLARTWFGKLSGEELALTKRVNFSRLVTFSAFTVGSIFSVIVSQRMGYGALAVPVVSSFLIYIAIREISRSLDKKFGGRKGAGNSGV